jgi:hypothetical protein
MNTENKNEFECCPPFDPTGLDDKIIKWKDKTFIKEKVRTFFFMPLNFGSAMRKLSKKMENSNAESPDWLCLSDHTSKWNMDVYLATDKEVTGSITYKLTGEYYCKVYEGPFKDTGKWAKDYNNRLLEKGLKAEKLYMWYTTCPKCAKKYGKNHTVFIGKVN